MSTLDSPSSSIESLNAFAEMLDHHGPDMNNWPAALRESAASLMAQSTQAELLVDEARALESLLQGLQIEPAASGLSGRIVASLPGDPWQHLIDWFASNLWRPLLIATAPLAVGFLVGLLQQDLSPLRDQQLAEELSQMVFSNQFEELPDEN